MLRSWLNVAWLAAESQQVICLRALKLAAGGLDAYDEACLMVSEKVSAGMDAAFDLMGGVTPDTVVSSYRSTVRANALRLARVPA